MNEKPIKVDARTDRQITDLAYLLGSTKKSIVREAVIEFAEARASRARVARRAGRSRVRTQRQPDEPEPASDERVPFEDLPLRERLALRRPELIRAFEEHGASNLRLIGALAVGEDADEVEMLAETDILMGGQAVPVLQEVARKLLGSPVAVISTTALGLFNPEGLRRALSDSVPL